ncbi:hypothetical protein Tco_1007939 [Tanacetum coccineum]
MFMHTARDDSILDAYKTYLAYAISAASPKMKRKLKKPSSPSKKRTLVNVEEEELKPAKKVKKAPTKVTRRRGIEFVFDAALLKEAQLKKALKRSKIETTIHQASGSSEGADFESKVPNEPKGKSIDTKTNDDEEETECVHTPPNYVPTNDETNDESNDVTEEVYERINEKLYGDVNIGLTNAEPDDEDKVKDDAQATQKIEVPIPSSSFSSDYAAKFLNFDNIPSVDTNVVSMLDINVQHEVPRTSPLLTIPLSVIPKHNVINPSETVTTASTTTISSLLTSLFPHLQQSTPIPTPTTTEATTSTTAISESETLVTLQLRVTNLEKDYLGSSIDDAMHKVIQKNVADIIKEHYVPAETVKRLRQKYAPQKSVEDIQEIKMEHARKKQVPKETITSSDTTTLAEFDQKTTLFETMNKSKSFNKIPKQRALYYALMESILKDEDAMDEGFADKLKKRKPDDADKDEDPSAGSDRGLKRRKTSKDTKQSKKAMSIETSKGTSKSQPKSTGKSVHTEEIVFEAGDTQRP